MRARSRRRSEAFGDKVLPLYLAADSPCTGLIGLLSQTHYEYSDGKRTTTHAPDASYSDAIEELRGTLIEGIIEESEDETLMERYLGGEEIDQSVLIEDLEKAVARASFFPVIPACSGTGVGTLELLEIITSGFRRPRNTSCPRSSRPGQDPQQGWPATARAAARRGGQDDVGPLRRQGQPGPGVLRDHQARRDGARVGPFLVVLRPRPTRLRRPATPTTTRTNASARCRSRSASSSGPRRRWWLATSARSAG